MLSAPGVAALCAGTRAIASGRGFATCVPRDVQAAAAMSSREGLPVIAASLQELNTLSRDDFVARLGAVYEHSPWVAELAWEARPFDSLDALARAMHTAVETASSAEQLALIRAHPELAGRLAVAGQLTAHSLSEQAGAGLSACTPEEFARLHALNAAYQTRFGFPFIVAVRGLTRTDVIARIEQRLANDRPQEIATCLREIARIARFRLEDLLGNPYPTLRNL
jgi:2-oxo-4-hydroxy-4-carboxy-5-ureidoimidazoline decarboxylase